MQLLVCLLSSFRTDKQTDKIGEKLLSVLSLIMNEKKKKKIVKYNKLRLKKKEEKLIHAHVLRQLKNIKKYFTQVLKSQ